ncbi:Chromosome II, complete genome, related [Eimeria maxima]|uniref:Chromosome II, complete genome, related n=1 Tax=Eimeria maxima TaxID=5804 RepID=U6M8N8_EIMMA|nr:Chromosome II, complete genome, related [Eimeria maxima]CDJ59438.1 Chromosome II, complete genome, related [Eimeria maxima]
MSGRNQIARSGSLYEDAESETLRRLSEFSMSDWMRKLGEAEVFESDLQHLILNYLTINGLGGPAEEFIREARIDPSPCDNMILLQLLNADAEVTFLLHKQQLLRLIEAGDAEEAIDFAQQHLAPCVKDCCPEAQRLIGGMEQREETARRIDEAILDLYRIEQGEFKCM